MATGDFRPVDPVHFIPSMMAVDCLLFHQRPGDANDDGIDPLSPEHIAARRTAVLDFISAALFRRRPAPKENERERTQ